MELRHLRSFVAVAEELHFHRAAARLHISQPPLSQQIKALEQELGVRLLDRNRRGVALTPAGAALLPEARAILAAVEEARELTRRVARGEVGRLRVGFVGSAMHGALPRLLRTHRERLPGVELDLRELTSAAQVEAIQADRIDVGVVRPPVPGDGLAFEAFEREELIVALPAGHRLEGRERLALRDLGEEPFVLLSRREAPGLQAAVTSAMARAVGAPEVVQEASEMQTVVGLVAAGLGISLVPASVGLDAFRGVTFTRLQEPAPTVELALAWRADAPPPLLDGLLAIVRELAPT